MTTDAFRSGSERDSISLTTPSLLARARRTRRRGPGSEQVTAPGDLDLEHAVVLVGVPRSRTSAPGTSPACFQRVMRRRSPSRISLHDRARARGRPVRNGSSQRRGSRPLAVGNRMTVRVLGRVLHVAVRSRRARARSRGARAPSCTGPVEPEHLHETSQDPVAPHHAQRPRARPRRSAAPSRGGRARRGARRDSRARHVGHAGRGRTSSARGESSVTVAPRFCPSVWIAFQVILARSGSAGWRASRVRPPGGVGSVLIYDNFGLSSNNSSPALPPARAPFPALRRVSSLG